ncbi:MAG: hypothetical protein JNM63_16005 [Spirochaetia bacterium]|nr:hypothetical protein [Spirochaetia bacterium]
MKTFSKMKIFLSASLSLAMISCGSMLDPSAGLEANEKSYVGMPAMAASTPLLFVTFEKNYGAYTEAMMQGDFNSLSSSAGLRAGRGQIFLNNGWRVLQVRYPVNAFDSPGSGVLFRAPLAASDELYYQVKVYFNHDFEWVKTGKLTGLAGGSIPAGGEPDPNGFSCRFLWKTDGVAALYLYHSEQTGTYGDVLPFTVPFKRSAWQTLRMRVKLNTPGVANGSLQAWMDGVQVYSKTNFRFRQAGATWKIDTFLFDTFYGGADASFAPTQHDNFACFDDVRIWKP